MTYGILSALALPLETIMLLLIAQDLFQGPQYNKMLGIIVSVNTAGYAVGTPIANLTFDCLGTYQPMLLASACVMAGVTICIQQLLSAAQQRKAPDGQKQDRKQTCGSTRTIRRCRTFYAAEDKVLVSFPESISAFGETQADAIRLIEGWLNAEYRAACPSIWKKSCGS